MRRIVVIAIILLAFIPMLFADGTRILDSETKEISAYKLSLSENSVPNQTMTLRLLNSNYDEFYANEIIGTPLDARDSDYPAFYWVLGGNIFSSVTLTFSFGPMWQYGQANSSAIPYKLKLTHTSSRVENTILACNKASTSVPISFLGYDFRYADSVSYPNEISVSDTAGTATVSYNMNTSYTTIQYNGQTATNYPYSVCNYWTRMGQATLHLQINENGVTTTNNTQLPDGMYYSTVTVTITTGT